MVNYLGKFILSLAQHTAPLHNLKKYIVFELQKSQLGAIEILKTLVTSAACLKILDSKSLTPSKTDASSVLPNLPISETCLKHFQLETKNETILQTLVTYTIHE